MPSLCSDICVHHWRVCTLSVRRFMGIWKERGKKRPLDGTVAWCISPLTGPSLFYVCFHHMALFYPLPVPSVCLPTTLPSSFSHFLFFSMHSMYGSCTAGNWTRNHTVQIDVRCLKSPGILTKDSLTATLCCTLITRLICSGSDI